MATPHISAPDGAFAKTLLMPGDPLRAKFIAETFLTEPTLVTSVRNVLGYTGTYKGVPVSVMASGMGMPSIGIYSWELYKFYGVENIIRIGSAGSYREWLGVMDVTLAESAVSESSFALVQGGETSHCLKPSDTLNAAIQKKAEELGIELKMSVVHSSDVFYSEPSQGTWQDIAKRTGSDCVEMESFALFHNARQLGKHAACLLTISDSFVNHVELTAEQRQNSFTEMMRLALETAITL
ncbi:MAG: purine-nucleoside phosphorylase [Bacteroidaceae bacterium]|nr:purine-nucleoside phosphorylase [Bacteroidaceae bacterium]